VAKATFTKKGGYKMTSQDIRIDMVDSNVRDVLVCGECGIEVDMEDKFCRRCGSEFVLVDDDILNLIDAQSMEINSLREDMNRIVRDLTCTQKALQCNLDAAIDVIESLKQNTCEKSNVVNNCNVSYSDLGLLANDEDEEGRDGLYTYKIMLKDFSMTVDADEFNIVKDKHGSPLCYEFKIGGETVASYKYDVVISVNKI
jgi:ribosomal protein L40E